MNRTGFLIFVFYFFFANFSISQNKKVIDSLENRLKIQGEDTTKANILISLCWENSRNDTKVAENYGRDGLKLSEKLNFKPGIARSIIYIGIINYFQGKYDTAMICYKKGLTLSQELKNTKLITKCLVNMGLVNAEQGKQEEALKYYFQALDIGEKANDPKSIAGATGNIGNIYFQQGDFGKAEECYIKAIDNYTKINDIRGISNNLTSLGAVYKEKKNYSKALEYDLKAVKLFEEQGDKNGLGRILNNIGVVYGDMHDFISSKKYYEDALKIHEEINDQRGICSDLTNLGLADLSLKRYDDALGSFNKSLALSKEIGILQEQSYNYEALSNLYKEKHDYENAYRFNVLFKKTNDSIFTSESANQLNELNTKYETEKKEQQIVLLNKDNEVKAGDLKIEQTRRYTLYGGLVLLIVFGGSMFNRFKVTQRQKKVIEIKNKETELQKAIIEEKQKEIIDSINYARRIQRSQLPTEKYIDRTLKRLNKS